MGACIVCLLVCQLEEPCQAACNRTVWDALEEEASNFNDVLRLKDSRYKISEYLSDPNQSFTVFALTDSSFLNSLRQLEGFPLDDFFSAFTETPMLYNSVALYNLVPDGAWDEDDLINLGTARTGLSLVEGNEYNLTFARDAEDKVIVLGLFPYNVTIQRSVKTCNGFLHVTSALIFPGAAVADVPLVNITWQEVADQKEECPYPSLYDSLMEEPLLRPHVQAAVDYLPSLLPALQKPLRGSLFLPSEEAVQGMRAQYGDPFGQQFNTTEWMLYSSLDVAHCPSDLIVTGSYQTCLGDQSAGLFLPLGFTMTPEGELCVWGPAPNQSNATVLGVYNICEAQVYLYDGKITPEDLWPNGYNWVDQVDDTATGTTTSLFVPAAPCVYPVTDKVLRAYPSHIGSQAELSPNTTTSEEEGDDIAVVAIAVPVAIGGVLLVLLVVVLGALALRNHRRNKHWLNRKSASAAPKPRGSDGDSSSIITEELVAAIATGANSLAKPGTAWNRQATLYKKAAKVLAPEMTRTNSFTSSMPVAEGTSSSGGGELSSGPMEPPLGASWLLGGAGKQAWEIPDEDLVICSRPDGSQHKLGYGSCGNVYLGVRSGIQDVAIKVLNKANCTAFAQQAGQLQREIALLRELRDRNIVQFYGACIQQDAVMLVTEYLPGGDLFHLFKDAKRSAEYKWYRKGQHVALDVTRGLAYLHTRRVVHLDLKSANILLALDGTAKLADMGLAQVLQQDCCTLPEEHGTYGWAAPELLMNMRLTEKADMYSLGVVLWELITHEEPRRGRLRPLVVPDDCPQEIKDLIDNCLHVMPADRPTAKEAFAIISQCVNRRSKDLHETAPGGE